MDQSALPAPPIAVRLLGGAAIEEGGRPLGGRAAHRHVLGLLALLATAPGRSSSRDKLVGLLWPEADPAGVRHRLNVTLYDLRKTLGRDAIVSTGDDLRLDPDVVWVDVVRFEEALERGDVDTAAELYRGAFLDGFHLPDALEFDDWVGGERERLARCFLRALESRAREAQERSEPVAAARLWRRMSALDPYGSRATLGLMGALTAAGERAEALQVAERHARTLAEELGVAPDPVVEALAGRIRSGEVRRSAKFAVLPSAPAGVEPAPAGSAEPRRRPWRLVAAAAVAAALLLAAWPWVAPRGGSADEVVPDRVIVLPFVVRGGDDYDYLGDGMAEILGTTLDGIGSLRTVDPHAVLAFVRENRLDPSDPSSGRRVAERFGAGRFVLGSIVESGRRIHVQATLYRVDQSIEARSAAGAGGDAEFFDMVDGLTRRLLIPLYDPDEEQMSRLAVTTSRSMPALKAYLEGETRLRAGEFEAATEAFREATREDSTFALAWYRQAVAAEWAFQPHDAGIAVERAVRLADRLPDRERLFLVGWSAYARGEADRAEAIYERILDERPEAVEAWLQLGEIRFHYAPSRGRSIIDSQEAFERVLALDPSQEGARIHLARIAALRRDLSSLDRHAQRLDARDPRSHAALEARGLRAFAVADREAIRALGEIIRAMDSYAVLAILLGSFFAEEVPGIEWSAELLAEDNRPVEVRTAGLTVLALSRVAGGRLDEADAAVAAAESLDPLRGAELRAILATLPFLEPDSARLSSAVMALDRTPALPDSGDSFFLPDHDRVRPLLRTYLSGLLAATRGDEAAAVREAAVLARMTAPRGDPTLAADLARGIRAEVHRQAGRTRQALAELSAIDEPPGYELVLPSPFQPRARERFLRARLLEQLGRREEAAVAYLRTGNRSFYDLPYRAPVQLRLAGLYERAGDRRAAVEAYRRFVTLWSEPDAELASGVTDARSRIGALAAGD